jgi:hypothetical protein
MNDATATRPRRRPIVYHQPRDLLAPPHSRTTSAAVPRDCSAPSPFYLFSELMFHMND